MRKYIIGLACLMMLAGCQYLQSKTEEVKPVAEVKVIEKNDTSETLKIATQEAPTSAKLEKKQVESFFPIESNCKWGFMDETGKVITKPKFYFIPSGFSEGYQVVVESAVLNSYKLDGCEYTQADQVFDYVMGYIDVYGRYMVNPRFDRALPFSEGLAVVGNGSWQSQGNEDWPVYIGNFGYIDKSGQYVINPQFIEAKSFSEGFAAVNSGLSDKPNWGFIDKAGNFLIKPQFDDVGDFHEGLAAVKIGLKWGFINVKGEVVIKPQFESAATFSEGFAGIGIYDNEYNGILYGFIDKTGKVSIEPKFYNAGSFSNGLAVVQTKVNISGGKWGYIGYSGDLMIESQFDIASTFSEGLALVAVMDPDGLSVVKWGFIDNTGSYVVSPHLSQKNADANLAIVRAVNSKDENFLENIRMMQFLTPGSYHDGLVMFFDAGDSYSSKSTIYFDKQGNEIIPRDDAQSGLLDSSANTVVVSEEVPEKTKPVVGINVTRQTIEDAFPDVHFKPSSETNAHGKTVTGWRQDGTTIRTIGPNENLYSVSITTSQIGLGIEYVNQALLDLVLAVDESLLQKGQGQGLIAQHVIYQMWIEALKSAPVLKPSVAQNKSGNLEDRIWHSVRYINGRKITFVLVAALEKNVLGDPDVYEYAEIYFEPDDRGDLSSNSGVDTNGWGKKVAAPMPVSVPVSSTHANSAINEKKKLDADKIINYFSASPYFMKFEKTTGIYPMDPSWYELRGSTILDGHKIEIILTYRGDLSARIEIYKEGLFKGLVNILTIDILTDFASVTTPDLLNDNAHLLSIMMEELGPQKYVATRTVNGMGVALFFLYDKDQIKLYINPIATF